MRIADALQHARAAGIDRLDAQWLLGHLLERPRSWLIAHDGDLLTAAQAARFTSRVRRRAAGEPLAYVVGEREFCGLVLQVSPAVLVPRPETELLVDWALACGDASASASASAAARAGAVVDLGTGSGAIALVLKHRRPGLQVSASDASAAALAVARANAGRLALDVEFRQGDWWAPWAGRRFALAVCNPPYVAGGDPHLAALGHEPRSALTPDAGAAGDGLAALRAVVAGAPRHLLAGAWLLLEHGHDQAEAVRQMLAGHGFSATQTRQDLAGLPRCTGAVLPAG